ncbi:PAS domain S-box protein [Parasediminibacterium sp. JCM 36343]|uniref:PAS domain S-box protein n=1 Tax=Parasediminibacterium sp. JCM 36343 TaxID=3374279 RepID=UPI00397C7BA1
MNNRSLKFSYVLSLTAIALILIMNYIIVNHQMIKTERTGNFIKIAIEQKSLSQEVALNCFQLLNGEGDRQSILLQLESNIRLLENGHNRLMKGFASLDAVNNSAKRQIYNQINPAYQSLLANAKQLDANNSRKEELLLTISQQEATFLKGMEMTVNEYSSEVEADLKKVQQLRLLCTLGLLSVIVFEALFILRPIGKRINKYIAEIENQNQRLQNQNIVLQVANEKVEQIELLFKKLSIHIPGVIYQFQLFDDGRSYFPYISERATEIFELSGEEIFSGGKKIFSYVHQDDVELFSKARQYSKDTLAQLDCEFRIVLPNKGLRWIHTQSTPERLPESVLWHGYVQDITERKKIDETLAKSQQLLSQAETIAKIGSSEVDFKTGKFLWSDEFYRIHGLKPQEFEPTPELSEPFLHPDDRYKIKLFEEAAVNKVDHLEFDSRIIRTDGAIRDISSYWKYTYDSDGIPLKMYGVVQDITEKKQLEAALKQSEAQFRGAFQYSAIGFALVNPDKTWKEVNESFCSMLGYTKEELLKLTFEKITHPDDLSLDLQYLQELAEGKRDSYQMEKRYFHKNGNIIWVLLAVSMIKDENGGAMQFIAQIQNITERKVAERELAESKAAYESLFYQNTAAVFSLDLEGNFTSANKVLTEKAECNIEAILKMHFVDFVYPQDLAQTIANFQFAKQGIAKEFEIRIVTATKKILSISLISMPIVVNNTIKGVYVIANDITAQKEQQEQIVKIKANQDALINSTDDLMWLIDNNFNLITSNKSFSEKVFTSMRKHLQEGDTVLHPEFGNKVNEKWRIIYERALKGEKFSFNDGEYNSLTKLPEYNQVTLNPMFNNMDEVYGVACYLKDITNYVNQQAEVVATRNELLNIMDSSPDVICTISKEGRFLNVSAASKRIWGYAPEELSGKPFIDFVAEEDREKTILIEKDIKAGNPVTNFENCYIRKNKEIIPIVWACRYDEAAQIIYCVARDATDKQKQELAMEKLNSQLTTRAQELSESNLELERFAYVASHDLQEPLRMVSSFLQLLQKRYNNSLDAKANEYINFAVDGAKRMKELILDMLEYSRINTGEVVFEEINLNDVFQEIAVTLSPSINGNNATVIASRLPVIHGIKSQIMQLLQNLIGNALKYKAEGVPPHISVIATNKGTEWEIMVKDNGIGIAPQFFEKIFIIFQRLHNKSVYTGTGIGLAICKKIVDKHGGRIWVESEVGKGSQFYFTIPSKEAIV